MDKIRLQEIKEFNGTLRVVGSGLRIGGSQDMGGIGESDNPIIRHPITNLPYVPGSSVKGKIRCLLESKYSEDSQRTGKPCACGECEICQLFGCGESKNLKTPTRLVFRDSQPTEETRKIWGDAGVTSEVKTEVLIDRRKGSAFGRIGPRSSERIPAGSDFQFSFSLRCFEGDDLGKYLEVLAEGFDLVEKHYLGGSGSRGYGEVAFLSGEGTPMSVFLRKLREAL